MYRKTGDTGWKIENYLAIWTNTLCHLQKYTVQGNRVAADEIRKLRWLNNNILDKYIQQSRQIQLSILKSTFCSSSRHRLSWCELKELVLREGDGEAQPIKSQLWWLCKVAEKKGKRSGGGGGRYNHNWVSAEKALRMLQTLKRCATWSFILFMLLNFK